MTETRWDIGQSTNHRVKSLTLTLSQDADGNWRGEIPASYVNAVTSSTLDVSINDRELAVDLPLKWDDILGSVDEGRAAAGLTKEKYRDTNFQMNFWRHNQDDELHFAYQMKHGWDGTSVKPHLHVVPTGDASGVFAVRGQMVWASVGQELPASASWTTFETSTYFHVTDRHKEAILGFGWSPDPDVGNPSDILCIRMVRDQANDDYTGTASNSTAAANVGLLSADAHIRVKAYGTEGEFSD